MDQIRRQCLQLHLPVRESTSQIINAGDAMKFSREAGAGQHLYPLVSSHDTLTTFRNTLRSTSPLYSVV